ncbi:MAG: SURF1 family protein [Lautropia sp.]
MKPARRRWGRRLLLAGSIAACAGFIALGNWQIERRAWKLDLIAATSERIHQPPVAVPGPAEWPRFDAGRDAYRRVRLEGRWLAGRETRVQATTVHGAGSWLLAPLLMPDGAVVLVNRGFVRSRQAAVDTSDAPVAITGLLRASEPGGGFPRRNVPAEDRWFSRDVAAIAQVRGLARVAPFFVDADADPAAAGREPIGGLTVVAFRNHHLGYALTWYGLALLAAAAAGLLAFEPLTARPRHWRQWRSWRHRIHWRHWRRGRRPAAARIAGG